jgi:PhnB protein
MSRVSIYLNFPRCTEEAFRFYAEVFRTAITQPIHRFHEAPAQPGQPPLAPQDRELIMHIEMPILGDCVLMGTDAPGSMGFQLNMGNNVHINLEPDTRSETERLFTALSQGGKVEMPLQDMFWGAYFGSLRDRYGVQWMFNCAASPG